MKRKLLLKILNEAGCKLLRNGAKHDIYFNQESGISQPVPRHADVNEILAKKIIKELTSK